MKTMLIAAIISMGIGEAGTSMIYANSINQTKDAAINIVSQIEGSKEFVERKPKQKSLGDGISMIIEEIGLE